MMDELSILHGYHNYIVFEDNSIVNLNNNTAGQDGGAIVSSNITFTGSSTTTFHNNLVR